MNNKETRQAVRRSGVTVGASVRSRYRSPWCGVVEAIDGPIASVRVEVDGRGRKLRKALQRELHVSWLEVLP